MLNPGDYQTRLLRQHRRPAISCHLCSLVIAKLTRSRMLIRGQFELTDNERMHYDLNRRVIDEEIALGLTR